MPLQFISLKVLFLMLNPNTHTACVLLRSKQCLRRAVDCEDLVHSKSQPQLNNYEASNLYHPALLHRWEGLVSSWCCESDWVCNAWNLSNTTKHEMNLDFPQIWSNLPSSSDFSNWSMKKRRNNSEVASPKPSVGPTWGQKHEISHNTWR